MWVWDCDHGIGIKMICLCQPSALHAFNTADSSVTSATEIFADNPFIAWEIAFAIIKELNTETATGSQMRASIP
jgi:hypothetical protein